MGKRIIKAAVLGGAAYSFLQNPKNRALVGATLDKVAASLRTLEGRHSDPTARVVADSPLGARIPGVKAKTYMAKADATVSKLPAGTFEKAASLVEKGRDRLQTEKDRQRGALENHTPITSEGAYLKD